MNVVLGVGLTTSIFGLVIGYFGGAGRAIPQVPPASNMHGAMGAMMSDLNGKTGDTLDLAFLNGMIVHHAGAIEMAQTLLKGTKRPELIKLGDDIITAQTAEIQMMKKWRKSWFNQ